MPTRKKSNKSKHGMPTEHKVIAEAHLPKKPATPKKEHEEPTPPAPSKEPVAPEPNPAEKTPAKPLLAPPDGVDVRAHGSWGNKRGAWCTGTNLPAEKVHKVSGKNGEYTTCPTCEKVLKVNVVQLKSGPAKKCPYHFAKKTEE
jgi:hypothetical protein